MPRSAFPAYASDCTHPNSSYGWSEKACALFISFMKSDHIDGFRMQA